MRWQELFDDLGAQLDHEAAVVRSAEADDDLRVARSRLTLTAWMATAGTELTVSMRDGTTVVGCVASYGEDWVVVRDGRGDVVVLVGSVTSASRAGSAPAALVAPSARSSLSLRTVLRGHVRRRAAVSVGTLTGVVRGTPDAVGAEHLEVAVHDLDVPRRADGVRAIAVLPFAAICWLRPEER
jgi:hypothetical protein